MKKFSALLIAVLLIFTVSVPAFAAGSFLKSPSAYKGPYLENASNSDSSWDGKVVVVPYLNRDELSEENRAAIEVAYDEIKNASDLSKLVKNIGDRTSVPVSDLSVSELFYAYDNKGNDGTYTIALECETLANFEALLSYADGVWSIVEDAKVDANGNLVFKTDSLGTFAIVVKTAKAPDTGDNGTVLVCFAVIAVAAVAVVSSVASKKKASKV